MTCESGQVLPCQKVRHYACRAVVLPPTTSSDDGQRQCMTILLYRHQDTAVAALHVLIIARQHVPANTAEHCYTIILSVHLSVTLW